MTGIHPPPCDPAARRFSLHDLDDAAVLFDAVAQRVYELNATAAYIWSCLEQAVPGPTIVRTLCVTFGFPPATAEARVRDVLASRHRSSPMAVPAAGRENPAPSRRPRELALRAAAVGRGRGCLLIAGAIAGTAHALAAALAADGFRLLGEDRIVLERRSLAVKPMPPPGVRGNAAGGALRRGAGADARSRRVRAIVFPRRTSVPTASLVPLPKPEALGRLVRGLGTAGDALDAPMVERLVRWIEGRDCLELCYARLDEGVKLLRGLLCAAGGRRA